MTWSWALGRYSRPWVFQVPALLLFQVRDPEPFHRLGCNKRFEMSEYGEFSGSRFRMTIEVNLAVGGIRLGYLGGRSKRDYRVLPAISEVQIDWTVTIILQGEASLQAGRDSPGH